MPKNNKSMAYYRKVVRNSIINEYRANDNQAKHITVDSGLLIKSVQACWMEDIVTCRMEQEGLESWLQSIENPKLLRALRLLKPKEAEFIYTITVNGFTTYEMADHLGISQSSTAERYKRIKEKIKKLMQKPD